MRNKSIEKRRVKKRIRVRTRSRRGRHTGIYNGFCQQIFNSGRRYDTDDGRVYMIGMVPSQRRGESACVVRLK